jgi:GWxTD domain-containing protein
VLLATAGVAAAGLSVVYRDYFAGPVGYLLTEPERAAWQRVTTDAEAERFLEVFWLRRDPDIATPENEFRLEFERRVSAADHLFGFGGTLGAMSARGRTLILLGMCDTHRDIAAGRDQGRQETQVTTRGGVATDERGAAQVWEYEASRFPPGLADDRVQLAFAESSPHFGDFDFVRRPGANMVGLRLLAAAPDWYIKHPEITEPPRPGYLANSLAASGAQLAWLDAPSRPWPAGAQVTAREGLLGGPRHFLWLDLMLPEPIPDGAVLVGRVRSPTGEVAGSFALAAEQAKATDLRIELAIPVAAGAWHLDVAVAGREGPLAVTGVEFQTTRAGEGTCFAPLLWGPELTARASWSAADPFVVGGWHVGLRPSDVYRANETLAWAGYVLDPLLDAAGLPGVTSRLVVRRESAVVMSSGPAPVKLSRVDDRTWMVGARLPLERLARPGAYVLSIELEQPADGTRRVAEIPFTIAP